MPSRQSHSPTLITDAQTNAYHHLRQGTDQVSTGLQSAHEDMTRQVIPRRPPVNLTSETIRQLRSAISRFSTGDQDIIYRTVSTLFSWALESVNGRYSAATCLTVATTHTTVHWSVAETFLSLFCTFLVLFIMFKLGSITRNFGFAPGTVIVIGLCDEIFVLDSETFSSWENTHAYLLRAFQGRLGVSYIEKRDYALGDSEHLFIEQHKWSVIVKAGSRLHMSVVVHGNGARCPYCGAVSVSGNDLNIDDRFLCSRCGRLYGALQGASVEDDDYPFNRPR
ncbi:hypothetical protein PENSPDRAFT_504974 [Peniophora sp. CONT]|nr:hypothetical protein PENSPDRAFT_504974 [Peniophora sp. CONT]